jgi:hypothetical protein
MTELFWMMYYFASPERKYSSSFLGSPTDKSSLQEFIVVITQPTELQPQPDFIAS